MSLDRLSRKKSCSLDSQGESLSPSDNSLSSNVCNIETRKIIIIIFLLIIQTFKCFQAAASNSDKSSKGSIKEEIKPKIPIKCKDKVKIINEKINPEEEVKI